MDERKHGSDHGDADRLRQEAEFDEAQARRLEDEARILKDRAHELKDEAREIDDEDGGDHGHGGDDGRRDKVKFTISVTGQPVTFEAGLDEPLAAVRAKALELSGNVGRAPEDWDLKDEAGTVLDLDRTVRDYHFGKEAFLFLSLKAGAAGER